MHRLFVCLFVVLIFLLVHHHYRHLLIIVLVVVVVVVVGVIPVFDAAVAVCLVTVEYVHSMW